MVHTPQFRNDWCLTVSWKNAIMVCVKFEWTFPDAVIFLPHSYLVIAVWLFLLSASWKIWQNGGWYLYGKWFFVSYQNAPQRKGLSSRTCTRWGSGRCTGSGDLRAYRRRTSIPHHYCNYRPKYRQEIVNLNAEVMGSSTAPYYGAPVVVLVLADGGASTFVEDGSCRTLCGEEGKYADQ